MMTFASFLTGRLSPEYLPTEPATIGAAIGLPLTALMIVAALTYFKKWTWLWKNWLTSLRSEERRVGKEC